MSDLLKKIEDLKGNNHKAGYEIFKELVYMSEKNNSVYQYMDMFIEMMNHPTNSFLRTKCLSLIAVNAKWDNQNKINHIINDYLKHIEDEKTITARQCIQNTVIIAKYKPELIDEILLALENSHKEYQESMQNLISKDKEKAIYMIRNKVF